MKFRIIVLTFLCLGFVCNAQNRLDKNGRRDGRWIRNDKDGSVIFEGTYDHGKETGTFKYYYPDKTLKIENTFIVPGRICSHKAYDEKGHLLATGFYNQKNRDSIWHIYNEDGALIKIAHYKMGIKEGAHIVFAANGDTAEVATWKDNRRHGRWWKRIGQKGWISGLYVEGLMQGRLAEYGDDGKLIREGNYKDGAKDGSYRYYENGNLVVDESWQEGILGDRKILLHTPTEHWQSIYGIAYFHAKGITGSLVYLNDGTKLTCSESMDIINERVGRDHFVLIDRKNRVMANIGNINGITRDADGRAILDLDPKPPFVIFPDDDCIKMIQSLKRIDQLDKD